MHEIDVGNSVEGILFRRELGNIPPRTERQRLAHEDIYNNWGGSLVAQLLLTTLPAPHECFTCRR